MCALRHIQWDNTGLYDDDILRNEQNFQPDEQITHTIRDCLSFGNFRPSNVVIYNQWERERCVQVWDEFDDLYQTILIRENPANAKYLAKEQYAQKVLRDLNDRGSPLSSLDEVQETVDHILLRGQRWRALAQDAQSADFLLIHRFRGTLDKYADVGDVVDHGTDEDFDGLRRLLLDPESHLKETCLRLTGVRDMVFELANAPVRSDLRKYLATAINTRIESVFGPAEEKWPDVLSSKRLSLTDDLQRNIVNILGICIKRMIDWSHVKNAPKDSPEHKLYQMCMQFVGENEHTTAKDVRKILEQEILEGEILEQDILEGDILEGDILEGDILEEEMQTDTGPTPPSAYINFSPSNFLEFE